MAIPDLLKSCPLFLELYDKEIEKIVKDCHVFSFEKGNYIAHKGHEGKEIFVILEGSVAIMTRTNDSDEPYERHVLRKGDLIGEASLLEERIYYSDIMAKTNAALLKIPYADIFKRFKTEPRVFAILMLNLSRMLARRLREAA